MEQLITTKLYIPPTRPEFVPRSRLIEQLNAGLSQKLTLISAPVGFGKTTLVSEWVRALEESTTPAKIAWLSLDESDGDLTRFLAYLVAAFQTVDVDLAQDVLSALQSSQPLSAEPALTAIINDITALHNQVVLILDDYHLIDARPVDEALIFLLEHLPPNLHLVITTREDPNLPLARLRARSQLNELRIADLRFTSSEVAEFLNQIMGLSLTVEEINTLETRTEGWIAGLQLAALSMRGLEDVHGFITAFAGDNRYIVDYLVAEVLERQPEEIRRFLLQTSILDRLNGSLCDAVVDQSDGDLVLEALERANLFVYPLDDKRRWFRYHTLFADVLQANAMQEQPDRLPVLHQRASEWYRRNGMPYDAIYHAFLAEDFKRAADLIELEWALMDRSRQSARWLGWARKLPYELIRARPVLCAGYAWALLDVGELEAGEGWLSEAERWLDKSDGSSEPEKAQPAGMVVLDEREFKLLPATTAAARAYLALAFGNVSGTVRYARQALAFLPAGDYLRRGTPSSLLGLASWAEGDLEEAGRAFSEAIQDFQKAGNILFAITGAFVLSEIRIAQGRLHEAHAAHQQSLQLVRGQNELVLRGAADLYTGLSGLLREWGDLEAANQQLLKSKELGAQAGLPRWHFRWCVSQARLKQSMGNLDEALALLDKAERAYVRGPVPDVQPIPAIRARVWIAQGRLADALAWARQRGLSADDQLNYLAEFEHITLARALIADYKHNATERAMLEVVGLLERLLRAAEQGGRTGSLIEILVLQALAYQAQGDLALALPSLQHALGLAEPEGYCRIFVEEGAPMAQLLTAAAARGIRPEYTGKLLAVLEAELQMSVNQSDHPSPSWREFQIEPLSQRELDVLQLVAQGLSNREISQRLFLSVNTVKGYNRTLFGKLQARNRTEAVVRAREMGLL